MWMYIISYPSTDNLHVIYHGWTKMLFSVMPCVCQGPFIYCLRRSEAQSHKNPDPTHREL